MKRTALAIALLALTACTSDQVTSSILTALNAALAVEPAVAKAANVDAATQVMIAGYLDDARKCATVAATALKVKPVVQARVAAAVAAGCATVAAGSPNLPKGTPANVVAAVQAVASAISAMLGNVAPQGVAPSNQALQVADEDLKKIDSKLDALKEHILKLKLNALTKG
jgi:hypothetical protein